MQPTELVTLNMRELDRLKVIQAVVDRMLKPGRAAERLQLTTRQIERLVLRYRQSGAAGIVSRARGRPGNRKLDEGVACHALRLIQERYVDSVKQNGRFTDNHLGRSTGMIVAGYSAMFVAPSL